MPAAPGSTALDAAYAAFADAMLEAAVAAEPTEWGGLIASASEEVGALAGTVPTGETLNAMKTTLDTVTKTLRDGGAPPDLSESIDGAGEAFVSYVKAVAGVPAQVPVPEVATAQEAVRAVEAGPVAPAYAFPGQRKPPVARTPESRKSVVAALNAVLKAVSAVQNTDALKLPRNAAGEMTGSQVSEELAPKVEAITALGKRLLGQEAITQSDMRALAAAIEPFKSAMQKWQFRYGQMLVDPAYTDVVRNTSDDRADGVLKADDASALRDAAIAAVGEVDTKVQVLAGRLPPPHNFMGTPPHVTKAAVELWPRVDAVFMGLKFGQGVDGAPLSVTIADVSQLALDIKAIGVDTSRMVRAVSRYLKAAASARSTESRTRATDVLNGMLRNLTVDSDKGIRLKAKALDMALDAEDNVPQAAHDLAAMLFAAGLKSAAQDIVDAAAEWGEPVEKSAAWGLPARVQGLAGKLRSLKPAAEAMPVLEAVERIVANMSGRKQADIPAKWMQELLDAAMRLVYATKGTEAGAVAGELSSAVSDEMYGGVQKSAPLIDLGGTGEWIDFGRGTSGKYGDPMGDASLKKDEGGLDAGPGSGGHDPYRKLKLKKAQLTEEAIDAVIAEELGRPGDDFGISAFQDPVMYRFHIGWDEKHLGEVRSLDDAREIMRDLRDTHPDLWGDDAAFVESVIRGIEAVRPTPAAILRYAESGTDPAAAAQALRALGLAEVAERILEADLRGTLKNTVLGFQQALRSSTAKGVKEAQVALQALLNAIGNSNPAALLRAGQQAVQALAAAGARQSASDLTRLVNAAAQAQPVAKALPFGPVGHAEMPAEAPADRVEATEPDPEVPEAPDPVEKSEHYFAVFLVPDAVDRQGDVVSAEEIALAVDRAQDKINSVGMDINHDGKPAEGLKLIRVFVAPEGMTINGATVTPGSGVAEFEAEGDMKAKIDSGDFGGLSIEGQATRKRDGEDANDKPGITPPDAEMAEKPAVALA